jgi:hypothetical protein
VRDVRHQARPLRRLHTRLIRFQTGVGGMPFGRIVVIAILADDAPVALGLWTICALGRRLTNRCVLRDLLRPALDERARVVEITVERLDRVLDTVLGSNLRTNRPGAFDLLSVGCRGDECVSERLHSKGANTAADTQRFDTVRPEVLVTEEGLNNNRDASWESQHEQRRA